MSYIENKLTLSFPMVMSLLDLISRNANWKGKDDFPSSPEWENEIEKWLEFLKVNGQLERFIPRLKSKPALRDEALAEISAAFYSDVYLNCPIVEWEPKGNGNSTLEFSIKVNDDINVLCEVKSPGWEGEIIDDESIDLSRKKQPKFQNGETRAIAPWKNIRETIKKAYPKFFSNKPSLLIINDDLFVSPLENLNNIEIALFCKKGEGNYGLGNYLSEDGYFLTKDFENLGGIFFLQVTQNSRKIVYKKKLVKNPSALPECQIPFLK